MSYLGDFAPGAMIDTKFTTYAGAPIVLSGSPVVSIYKDNDTTQSTAGVTLSADFDGIVGLNNLRIDLSADGTFYSAGSNFQAVITTGTVGGVSAVGTVLAEFSIHARSFLRPTTAGRTLDVSAGGEAGVDWANVGSPTTTVGLSGTTTKDVTDVETALAAISAFIDTEVAAIKTQTDKLTFTVANQIDANVIDWKGATAPAMSGDAFARLGAPAGASVSADIAAVKVDTAAIKAKTDNLPASPAAVGSAMTLTAAYDAAKTAAQAGDNMGMTNAGADAILDRAAGIETAWTLRQGLRIMLASLAAKLSGAATTEVVIRDVGDTKDRITATVDADGNRTGVTYDKT